MVLPWSCSTPSQVSVTPIWGAVWWALSGFRHNLIPVFLSFTKPGQAFFIKCDSFFVFLKLPCTIRGKDWPGSLQVISVKRTESWNIVQNTSGWKKSLRSRAPGFLMGDKAFALPGSQSSKAVVVYTQPLQAAGTPMESQKNLKTALSLRSRRAIVLGCKSHQQIWRESLEQTQSKWVHFLHNRVSVVKCLTSPFGRLQIGFASGQLKNTEHALENPVPAGSCTECLGTHGSVDLSMSAWALGTRQRQGDWQLLSIVFLTTNIHPWLLLAMDPWSVLAGPKYFLPLCLGSIQTSTKMLWSSALWVDVAASPAKRTSTSFLSLLSGELLHLPPCIPLPMNASVI